MKGLKFGLVLTVALWGANCSNSNDDLSKENSAATAEGTETPVPEGYGPLMKCDVVGEPCNAHNPCAIDPVCGADKLCHPSKLQNCDDGLDCTTDICLGRGRCDNSPSPDTCLLQVKVASATPAPSVDAGFVPVEKVNKCFKAKDRSPDDACQQCDPAKEQRKWSPASGGSCDDGNACTKDDYCQAGTCKGFDYRAQCADEYDCTTDTCDGKGGCLGNTLSAGWCLINGTCYRDQQTDTTGCQVCDAAKSNSAWSAIANFCKIADKCYKAGENDSSGCNTCDPTKSTTAWTPVAGYCKIGTKCYSQGTVNSGGCGECDTAVSATAWTVKNTTSCLIKDVCYKADDKDSTGCLICSPATNKYDWTSLPGTCKIGNTCYKPGDQDSTKCGVCDPTKNAKDWTVTGDTCLISGKCYQPGALNTNGCSACTPATSKNAWSPLANKCMIADKCYNDADKDATGCFACSYAAAPTSWTLIAGATKHPYDFEAGNLTGWTSTSSDPTVGWNVTNRRPKNGSYSLYYGNPSKGNYETYDANGNDTENEGQTISSPITIVAGKKSALGFWFYQDVESLSSYDKTEIFVNADKVWGRDIAKPAQKTWLYFNVDLSKYAGQTVKLTVKFTTGDETTNATEGVFIDDLTIFDGC